jgi:transcriptional regulator with XRE-family HTH domain
MNASTTGTHFLRAALRHAFPRATAKHVARAAGVSHRTAEGWLSGDHEPRLSALLRLAIACEGFAEALEAHVHARRAASDVGARGASSGRAAAPGGGARDDG